MLGETNEAQQFMIEFMDRRFKPSFSQTASKSLNTNTNKNKSRSDSPYRKQGGGGGKVWECLARSFGRSVVNG
jgi:hypothetical protein